MVRKEKEEIPQQAWLRVALLILVLGGLFWFLAPKIQNSKGEVEGEKTPLDFLPEPAQETFQVLGEKVKQAVPEEAKKEILATVEESQIVEEIRKTVNQITKEIEGFPKKQEKEIKKKIIEEIYSRLIKDLEDE